MITPVMCYTTSDGKVFQNINDAMNYEQLTIECGAISQLVKNVSCVDDDPEAADQALQRFKALGRKVFSENRYWNFRECQYGQMEGSIYKLLSDHSSTYTCLWVLYRKLSQIKPSQNSILFYPGHTYPNGEWVYINRAEHTWEYQPYPNDSESYIEGSFQTDDHDRFKVIDYDGCFELPKAVYDGLASLDYDLSELNLQYE